MNRIEDILKNNLYPGRGIIVGLDKSGDNALIAYFIMGRSKNSRNRIFKKTTDGVMIYPFDESKVSDPSLVIYTPVRKIGNSVIVTNGDQTDTIYDYIEKGLTFEDALNARCYEPDAPNFTPRISAVLSFDGGFSYKLSILKKSACDGCNRFYFNFAPARGVAHFIHTYNCDGNPIPSFCGEPKAIDFDSGGVEEFANGIWQSLNEDNKVSMYAASISVKTQEVKTIIYNKNKDD